MKNRILKNILIIAAVFVALGITAIAVFAKSPSEPVSSPQDPLQDEPISVVIIPNENEGPDIPDVPPKDDKPSVITPVVTEAPVQGLKIYIDPGHGFNDPGTVYTLSDGTLLKESDITLKLSQLVCRKLAANGFEVKISHDSNLLSNNPDKSSSQKMTLGYRCNDANAWNADLFLSIHVNSYPGSSDASGIKCFYAASKKATFKSAAHEFCVTLNRACIGAVGERKNSVASYDYAVLKGTNMIAALLEIGFITNPADRANMQDDLWLSKMADGIVNGIVSFTGSDSFKSIN